MLVSSCRCDSGQADHSECDTPMILPLNEMKVIEYIEPIYTFEIDSNQHVSNIAYIQWMEIDIRSRKQT